MYALGRVGVARGRRMHWRVGGARGRRMHWDVWVELGAGVCIGTCGWS